MKKICAAFLMALLVVGPASADILVPDPNDLISLPNNPQFVTPNNTTTEEAWLESLLGFNVDLITKDEVDNLLDNFNGPYVYAILKYGQGLVPLDHLALYNIEGDNVVQVPFPYDTLQGLSHTTYFNSTPVPEPATMILFGMGLFGLAAFGRKKFK